MKSDTRRARMAALIAEDENDPIFELIKKQEEEKKAQEQINEEETTSREGEAVLRFLENPEMFSLKICKRCEGTFAVNYGCVSYCSDSCRAAALKELGIDWDASKPLYKRWGVGPIPLVLAPNVLETLRDFAEAQALQNGRDEQALVQ